MIARTKFQRRVKELAQDSFSEIRTYKDHQLRVQIVTEEQKDWIFKNCFEHNAFATKHKAGCMDCGATFPTSIIKDEKIICPECHTNLKVVHTKKRLDSQSCYVAQAIPVKEFQVVRNFYATAYYKKGKECEFRVYEVLQYWADTKGNTQLYGQIPSGWSQNFSGGFECRKDYGGYYGRGKWDIEPLKYLPGSRFRKEFARAGITRTKLLKKYHFMKAATVFMNPIGETLYKRGETNLLHVMMENPKIIKSLWPSIKICFRRNYVIYDVRTWMDYIKFLQKHGKDLHSPKYICPEDLHGEHDKYVQKERKARERQRRIQERENERLRAVQLAERLERDKKMEEGYAKKKAKYLGLKFSNGTYSAHFLNSIKEFKEEGDAMNHCVFSREYFKESTLLFSVRKDGERYATAELSIKTWRMLQIRSNGNAVSPESEQIEQFFIENFKKISAYANRKEKKRTRVIQKQELEVAC